MTSFEHIALKIIQEQELIIGPLAWTMAREVTGITITNELQRRVAFTSDPRSTIDTLVAQYERLFGRASHEVCRHAVATLIADLTREQVPVSLR